MGKIKRTIPVFITVSVFVLFYIKRFIFLKFYPPVCNLFVFLVFFISLFKKETIIQKIAKALDGELSKNQITYTRYVTYAWCILTFFNFVISIWTIFLSDKIWLLFNCCISYILIGLLFIIEYLIRIILRKKGLI